MAGEVDFHGTTPMFTVAAGTVASGGPDLSISANIINSSGSGGGLEKGGAGILALSGANTYNGGTMLDAGTIYIGSNTALVLEL